MIDHFKTRILFILILFFVGWSCNKEKTEIRPIAAVEVSPVSGLTTDTFRFDVSKSIPGSSDQKSYFRWDWNNDGNWDDEYSRLAHINHRFYTPGTHSTKVEVINSSGLIDTTSVNIIVEQGYSRPRADFIASPDQGNFKTEFLFDASGTKDDEDSLETLQFRWDFGDTDFWDIGFKHSAVASHTYADTGLFKVRMEVKDPSNKIDSKELDIHISNINPELVADFVWEPQFGTTADTFKLDASVSYHKIEGEGIWGYSWKLPPEYEWTEWSQNPTFNYRFPREVIYDVELRIKDGEGLVNFSHKKIQIYHENLPPNPEFRIGSRRGNINTQFYFDSWPTVDLESLPTKLQVRWDFDGDGNFDTDFSFDRVAYRQYPEAGTYKVILEAMDPDGLSDTTSHYIEVSPWQNETGLVWDHRDDQYYGTVKIGDQWWMSRNLDFSPTDWQKDATRKWCYSRYENDPINWCNIYGGLYDVYHATRNDWYGDVEGICPKGWHIPSRIEWEELIKHIGGYLQAEKLSDGGETGFNALLGGYGFEKWDPEKKVYIMDYKGRNGITYFWSFTPLLGGLESVSSWNLALLKDDDKISTGYSSNRLFYSVRCIKDDE